MRCSYILHNNIEKSAVFQNLEIPIVCSLEWKAHCTACNKTISQLPTNPTSLLCFSSAFLQLAKVYPVFFLSAARALFSRPPDPPEPA